MKWRRISGATKLLSRILKILKIPQNFLFFFFKICSIKIKIFKKTDNMLEGNDWWIRVQNFKSMSSKMAEIWHKTCQKQALFTSFVFSIQLYFLTDFDASKSVLGSFFSRYLRKSDLKTCIAALNHDFFVWPFFTWWPDMTLTSIMVIKHSKWYLQMSETLSMPISWLCLCLTSQFCSPMSPSPKCRTFWLWPDLWRHSWPRGQYNLFSLGSFSRAFKFRLNF